MPKSTKTPELNPATTSIICEQTRLSHLSERTSTAECDNMRIKTIPLINSKSFQFLNYARDDVPADLHMLTIRNITLLCIVSRVPLSNKVLITF